MVCVVHALFSAVTFSNTTELSTKLPIFPVPPMGGVVITRTSYPSAANVSYANPLQLKVAAAGNGPTAGVTIQSSACPCGLYHEVLNAAVSVG